MAADTSSRGRCPAATGTRVSRRSFLTAASSTIAGTAFAAGPIADAALGATESDIQALFLQLRELGMSMD